MMRNHKIGLGVLMTILAVVSTSISSDNLPVILTASQVLAQTTKEGQAQADRLLQQGIQQYQTSQFEAALQSWQQALIIYSPSGKAEGRRQRAEGRCDGLYENEMPSALPCPKGCKIRVNISP